MTSFLNFTVFFGITIASLLQATFLLWIFWVAIAGMIERYKRKTYTGFKLRLYQLCFIIFIIGDVLYNYIFAPLIFFDLATWERNTFTLRLKGYLKYEPNSWRGKLARLICEYWVDPHEPGHCGLI